MDSDFLDGGLDDSRLASNFCICVRWLFGRIRERLFHVIIVRLGVEIPGAAFFAFVYIHECNPIQIRCVLRDRTVGLTVVDALNRGADLEVANLARISSGLSDQL